MEKSVQFNEQQKRMFILSNWEAMQLFGSVCKAYNSISCYEESGMENMLVNVKAAVKHICSSFREAGHAYDNGKWFGVMYQEEDVGYVKDMEEESEMFRKLFYGYCYDLSQVKFDNFTADQFDIILRDIVAIGSMFVTKDVLEKVMFGEE